MRLLAQIGMKLEIVDDAEFLLESVLEFEPGYHAARYDYAVVLTQRHKHAKALEEIEKLRSVGARQSRLPHDLRQRPASVWAIMKKRCACIGSSWPGRPILRTCILSIAHSLKTLGRQSEAIEAYRAAARAQPSFGDAYWSLANLKTYRFTDEEIERMRAQGGRARRLSRSRIGFTSCFALGKALEDRARVRRVVPLLRARQRHQEAADPLSARRCTSGTCALQASVCTREFFAARAGCRLRPARSDLHRRPAALRLHPARADPRLALPGGRHDGAAGHSPRLSDDDRRPPAGRVQSALSGDARGARRPASCVSSASDISNGHAGPPHTGKPFFIDKMPNNFRAHRLHPSDPAERQDHRCAARSRWTAAFSNFKQLFAIGQEFTYSIEDIARYYRSYVELMRHWDTALPGKVLRVQHEDGGRGSGRQRARAMLDFLGLAIRAGVPGVLQDRAQRAHRELRAGARSPSRGRASSRWRSYEPWLEPLEGGAGAARRPGEQPRAQRAHDGRARSSGL